MVKSHLWRLSTFTRRATAVRFKPETWDRVIWTVKGNPLWQHCLDWGGQSQDHGEGGKALLFGDKVEFEDQPHPVPSLHSQQIPTPVQMLVPAVMCGDIGLCLGCCPSSKMGIYVQSTNVN